MKLSKKRIALLVLFLLAVVVFWFSGVDEYLTFEYLKQNRELLRAYVHGHYEAMVAAYIALYMSTALFIPGAIPMTLAGGFLFGIVRGTVYVNIGATLGATMAFMAARYLLGNWMQQRYQDRLKAFNNEVARHGHNYLLTLRMVPLFPFFLVNYFAGLTRVPLRTFVWTTSLGMVPGSLAYTFAGQQLGAINAPGDILSLEMFLAFLLLGLFALLPVLSRLRTRKRLRD